MPDEYEAPLRLGCFLGVLLVMTACEYIFPRRRLTVRKAPRWASNLALVALNIGLTRLVVPVSAVATALYTESRRWGALQLTDWPLAVEFILAVVVLDLAIYLQHVMFHAVPALWRLHLVHHADLDIDVTTGLRFHTLEILLSALYKLVWVVVLGPPPSAVLAFEVLLNATAMFNHSNVRLPLRCDAILRWILVTPDMHRVHHSCLPAESNTNFGFNLPWWDRLLGTYRAEPQEGHEAMTLGLASPRDEAIVERLPGMLLLPFLRTTAQSQAQSVTRSDVPPTET